jgi:hypothetical protein
VAEALEATDPTLLKPQFLHFISILARIAPFGTKLHKNDGIHNGTIFIAFTSVFTLLEVQKGDYPNKENVIGLTQSMELLSFAEEIGI